MENGYFEGGNNETKFKMAATPNHPVLLNRPSWLLRIPEVATIHQPESTIQAAEQLYPIGLEIMEWREHAVKEGVYREILDLIRGEVGTVDSENIRKWLVQKEKALTNGLFASNSGNSNPEFYLQDANKHDSLWVLKYRIEDRKSAPGLVEYNFRVQRRFINQLQPGQLGQPIKMHDAKQLLIAARAYQNIVWNGFYINYPYL